MNSVIDDVLQRHEFTLEPPICIDLGASGALPREWASLARYSICLAFDADVRDFSSQEQLSSEWRRLVKINRLVSSNCGVYQKFYLTASPYCSSSLLPLNHALEPWEFRDLFKVEGSIDLPSVTLSHVLQELGITYIDWFKSDTQGTDLRLFAALPEDIRSNVLAVDFEPGIIDAYEGEDKLHDVLRYMDALPFFLSDMNVKGSRRLCKTAQAVIGRKLAGRTPHLKCSPNWAEVCFLHDLSRDSTTIRDLLLAWVIGAIKEQHGHALLATQIGQERFSDDIFAICESSSLAALTAVDHQSINPHRSASLISRCARRLATWLMNHC